MSKKKLALTVRPEPPSFGEIEKDIEVAGDNDIIFLENTDGEFRILELSVTVLDLGQDQDCLVKHSTLTVLSACTID